MSTDGPLDADGVMGAAPSEIIVGSLFLARLANARPHKLRLLNRLMLGSYILPQEWDHTSMDTVAPGPKAAREIIHC